MRLILLSLLLAPLLLGAPDSHAQGQRKQQRQQQDQGEPQEQAQPQSHPPSRRQGQGQGQSKPRGLVDQANLAYQAGRYAEAEPLYRQVLELREQKAGEESMPVVQVLNRLGHCVLELGRFDEAEALFRRALATAEQFGGGETPGVAASLNNVGLALRRQGRGPEAVPIIRRALAMRESLLGPEHPEIASTLVNLAQAQGYGRNPQEAEAMLRRALAIREKAFGPDHPATAAARNVLSVALRYTGHGEEAVALVRRALAAQEARLGPDHPAIGQALNALGMAELTQRHYAEAEAAFRRSAAIREKALGPSHPDVAQAYGNLAYALSRQNKAEEGLEAIRRATAIHIARRESDDRRTDEASEGERRSARWLFARQAGIDLLVASRRGAAGNDLVRDAFEMQQWAQTGGVNGAVARMAARFAAGEGPLAALVRERQDLQARRQVLDRALIEAVARPTAERDRAEEDRMRAERGEIDRRLDALDARLAKEFPRYAELSAAKPIPLDAARALLGPGEAMLVYLVRDDDAFLWLLRKERFFWRRLAVDRRTLDGEIKGLRARLDPANNPRFEPVPLDLAHKLYRELFPDLDQALAGVQHLLIVPDGPLQSLPFSVLLTQPAEGDAKDPATLAAAPWLIRRYGQTVLPAVASLRALRAVAASAKDRAPFVGFGDPVLSGSGGAPAQRNAAELTPAAASLAALKSLEPLPETATELRALAKSMQAPPDAVHLGQAATETAVKHADLQRYRVLAFATHGLMAGEFGDNAEPALVLTPPAVATPEDDGLLNASEVAQLKLDADWVILSACNTAAPDGTPGAEGLSGLAKAFFYAGARSLLVSNWAVSSDAAVRLTTGAVAAMDKEPSLGRAEALRRSMLALLDDRTAPAIMAHPMFWAPFVLVGEGGSAR